jgi:transcriptional regulator with XRE-family HTH domain
LTWTPVDPKPTVRRRVLGTNLRRLREENGLLLEHAAEQLSCYPSKISRIESGRSPVRPLDLKALLDLYGVKNEATREGWLSLARESRKQRWWRVLEDRLPQDFLDLIGLEEDTSYCRGFQPGIVNGLFQTKEYAEAVIGGGSAGPLDENGRTKLDFRLERQKALTRSENPITVWMILARRLDGDRTGGGVPGSAAARRRVRRGLGLCGVRPPGGSRPSSLATSSSVLPSIGLTSRWSRFFTVLPSGTRMNIRVGGIWRARTSSTVGSQEPISTWP